MKDLYSLARKHSLYVMNQVDSPRLVLIGSSHTIHNGVLQYSFLKDTLTSDDCVMFEGLDYFNPKVPNFLKNILLYPSAIDYVRNNFTLDDRNFDSILDDITQCEFFNTKHFKPFFPIHSIFINEILFLPCLQNNAEIRGLGDGDIVREVLKAWGAGNPKIDERNHIFSDKIKTALGETKGTIYVITGSSHIDGLCKLLDDESAVILASTKFSYNDCLLYQFRFYFW